MANTYPTIGRYPLVPAADLASATSAINTVNGDTRKGGDSSGKKAGLEVIRDSSGTYAKYISKGAAATSAWQLVDGSAAVTPS